MFQRFFSRISQWLLPYLVPPSWGLYGSRGGSLLTQREAFGIAAVWACIDVIVRGLSSTSWNVYMMSPGMERKRILLDDDPIAWLLNVEPNPEMTAIAFRSSIGWNLIPNGRAYALIEWKANKAVALWPVENRDFVERRNMETGDLEYWYRGEVFGPDEVLHFVGPGQDAWNGDNLLQRALDTIGLSYAVQNAALDFFGRGAQLAGAYTSPLMLGDARKKKMISDFEEFYAGNSNSHKPLILDGGMTFTPFASTQRDSMSLEERKFLAEEVARWFGVPPHKIGLMANVSYSSIEQSDIEFVRSCLMPWSKRLTQEVDRKLFSKRSPWRVSEIDLRSLTMGDFASRAAAYGSMHTNGLMNANEVRHYEGLNDIGPEGDVFFMQGALQPTPKLIGSIDAGGAPTDLQQQAMNGAQITSLVEVVTAVGNGEISRDSGIQIVKVAFQLSDAQAAALLGPPDFKPAPAPEQSPQQVAISEAWKRYEARASNRGERPDSDEWRDKQAAQLAKEVEPFAAFGGAMPTAENFREGMRNQKCPSI